ncbi:MAG: polysaccharide pyruvyl transferase family protein [Cyclobacteriaceae bacterium]
MNRRKYLRSMALISGGMALSQSSFGKALCLLEKKKTILLCTGRQFCNIGDVGHVTGILNLLNIYLPDSNIILWPRINVRQFDELILKYWPDVQIVNARLRNEAGEIDSNGKPDNKEIYKAAEQADFFLAGSGGGIMEGVQWLANNYKKPYGAYGVTIGSPPTGSHKEIADGASFIFTRDTDSLENLIKGNVKCKILEFAPDVTFASIVEDDQKASAFMNKHGLTYKQFICVVPRLRVTPYYRIPPSLRSNPQPWSEERIREVDELNNKHKEEDHAKAREAMITWVRRTGNPVLLCPEMIHNMEFFDELLVDPLPADVKKKVIKREYFWETDEAATVYKNAVAVLSFECHSPILAAVKGTPAFYLRQPEDTIKGQMWYDIGLSDWVFEIEQTEGKDISNRLMEVYDDYPKARLYLESGMDYVRKVQWGSMTNVREEAGLFGNIETLG